MSTTLTRARPEPAAPSPGRSGRTTTAPHAPSRPSSSRIRGLDGLRALAVLAVLVYHTWPQALPGGFLGVDVFFVVSGFLITTLLLREVRDAGRLDLRRFWARRARRLLPALATVVVTGVLLARLVEPDLLVGIGRQVLGAATFSSNWLAVAAEASYFDQTAPQLFATFWSLAIEEQFYLIWPVALAVLLAVVRTWRARVAVAGAAALASAVAMAVLYAPGADPTRVYYGTDTHVVGLLLGVGAAFWLSGRAGRGLPLPLRRLAPVAVVALVALMALLHSDAAFTYRGGILLASVLALLAVLGCAAGRGPYVRVLESRPLVWVGERSYGIYLWHWPLLLVVAAAADAPPRSPSWWATTALALAATFGLAAASYRWVEAPVRRDGFRATLARVATASRRPAPRLAAALVSLAVVCAMVATATAPRSSGAQQSVEAGLAAIADSSASSPDGDAAADPGTDVPPDAAPSAGTPPDAAPEAPPPVTGEQISAFGDSVLSGAAPAVLTRFPGIALDAEPIRKWLDAPALVQAALDAGTLRDVVVLNFGTNGGFQFDGSEDAMRQVLDLIGPERRVVLVNTVGVSYWVPDANALLAAIAADYPNVVVADWHAAVADRPELLHSDRTHPTMAGTEVYADVVQAALAELGPPPQG
ncbi:acyltransferase 3 [Beutenbergia cavernae DSM 12333]|uniref:Acyltransferase 3 n=1 Tax=Beutenbergia cavernae (strain ATCC BAA-8 / DSM 12333 / CCUG 43141 / JCM 11478 / NBRC 16432 / NCIMB 13614 / HKI 0122) TaxID=471853 RepID=C5BZT7_BEUC1|nr:acyltransferase family protein [Beutenbergia cavernae]ACQ81267.1 acyltransferase 3 [Beutenbergia cavernae DSM 12333]